MTRFAAWLSIGLLLASMTAPARGQDGLVVVELFTSQGCSSCPPANAVIGEVARRDNVLVLSQHVAYWDYIGWADPFAIPQTTARQKAYARALNLNYVSTPQVIVQGQHELTGTDRDRLLAVIASVDSSGGPRIALGETATGHLEIGVSAAGRPANGDIAERPANGDIVERPASGNIVVVTFDSHRRTLVPRGENRGRTLDTYNVVRTIQAVGVWRGQPTTVKTSLRINQLPGDGGAVLIQEQESLRILAAAALKL